MAFPFQNNPEIKGASQLAENQLSESYPAIYKHLLSFKEQLSNRNKAETGFDMNGMHCKGGG